MPTTDTVILDEKAIAEIEARAEKASPAPWNSPANRQPWPDESPLLESIVCGDGGYINHRNWKQVCLNMDFISQARTDIPALCQAVRVLRSAKDVLLTEARRAEELAVRKWRDTEDDRDRLQVRLAQVEQERNDANERATEAQSNVAHLTQVIFSNRHVHHFRTRAIQMCRDKAAEWQALFDSDVSGDHDDKAYYAKAAKELAEGLETL